VPADAPARSCQVFAAEDIFVHHGVNAGDGLADTDMLCPGDIYHLDAAAVPRRLLLDGGRVGAGSEIGTPGAAVAVRARLSLMGADGDGVDLVVLDLGDGAAAVLPLTPLGARIDYTLLAVETEAGDTPLTDLLCVSFARGTAITLGDGRPRAIEDLRPGDMVLTRDHGRQPVAWVGRATLRAVGAFAPVVITRGAYGNAADLILSPHHRIFLYQRDRRPGVPTAELLVQAKHLVDGEAVYRREGGFVDYFSLVFARHEIIYAEGIPAESLLVSEATVTRLPPEIAAEVKARFPGLSQSQHFGTEAGRGLIASLGDAIRPRGSRLN
jgi:hypothetical protein